MKPTWSSRWSLHRTQASQQCLRIQQLAWECLDSPVWVRSVFIRSQLSVQCTWGQCCFHGLSPLRRISKSCWRLFFPASGCSRASQTSCDWKGKGCIAIKSIFVQGSLHDRSATAGSTLRCRNIREQWGICDLGFALPLSFKTILFSLKHITLARAAFITSWKFRSPFV